MFSAILEPVFLIWVGEVRLFSVHVKRETIKVTHIQVCDYASACMTCIYLVLQIALKFLDTHVYL